MNEINEKLLKAAMNGDTESVHSLLNEKPDINLSDPIANLTLIYAAMFGHTNIVNILLKATNNVNIQDNNGYSALHWAARNGHTAIIDSLISAKVDVNIQSYEGYSALHWAAMNGHTAIIDRLINAKANVDIQDRQGIYPMHWAAMEGHTESVHRLLAARTNVNIRNTSGITPLMLAAINGHTDIVNILLNEKANFDIPDRMGNIPLIYAARFGHTNIVNILLKKTNDINSRNHNGYSALHWAAMNGHTDIFNRLLDHGATAEELEENLGLLSNKKVTIRTFIQESNSEKLVQYLRDKDISSKLKLVKEKTSIFEKIIKQQYNKAKELYTFEQRENNYPEYIMQHIYSKITEHCNAICSSVASLSNLNSLLNAKTNVNIQNSDDILPLHWFAMNSYIDNLNSLLNAKTSVNIEDNNGYSVLHWAAKKGYIDIFNKLLDHGATTDALEESLGSLSNEKVTVRTFIQEKNPEKLIQYLRDKDISFKLKSIKEKHSIFIKIIKQQYNKAKELRTLEQRESNSPNYIMQHIYSKITEYCNAVCSSAAELSNSIADDNRSREESVVTHPFNRGL